MQDLVIVKAANTGTCPRCNRVLGLKPNGSLPPHNIRERDALPCKDGDAAATELSWQESALCAQTDPEAFFPEKGGSTREAKVVCFRCPVRQECLDYALENDERYGIWGGLSERERRRAKKAAV